MDERQADSGNLQSKVTRRHGCPNFDVVKMFAATKAKDREVLGETITGWLAANNHLVVTDREITQSSDNEFHCVTVTLFCSFHHGIDKRSDHMRRHADDSSRHRRNFGGSKR